MSAADRRRRVTTAPPREPSPGRRASAVPPSGNIRRSVDLGPPSAAAPPSAPRRRVAALGRALRVAVGAALVLGTGGAVAWVGARYVQTSRRFQVAEIVTEGAKRRTPDELWSIAGLAKGQNIFSTDLDRARRLLLADPWISEATLARKLPGTVHLRVVEREAAGLVATGDGTYLVDRTGGILKRLEPGDPTDLQVVTGVSAADLASDRDAATRGIRQALDLAAEYERSPLAQRSPLQEVHVGTGGEMSIVVGKSATTLKLGPPPFRRKLEQALRVLTELDHRGGRPDTIMLDNEAHPERVVVRMR